MAKHAHELRAYPHGSAEAANNIEYVRGKENIQVNEHQINAQNTHNCTVDLPSTSTSICRGRRDTMSMIYVDPDQELQPALKKLQCRVLQLQPVLIPGGGDDQESGVKDVNPCRERECGERSKDRLTIATGEPEIHSETTDAEKGSLFSKEDSAPLIQSAEEELAECVTPTTREQRISDSKDTWVCPPPPMKRRPTSFKRISRSSEHRRLLINPPDLHNFPDCIRALFDK